MGRFKRGYRSVMTGIKKSLRKVGGTDLKDQVGNAGDVGRKDLGNLGDDARKAGSTPPGGGGAPGRR
jgi:hypothetical protein